MNTSHPVNDKDDLSALRVNVGDHFANEFAHNAFLQADVSTRITPDRFRSVASIANCSGLDGAVTEVLPRCCSIRFSSSETRSRERFQRSSNSPATRRLAGSVASYCRNALSAA